MAVNPMLSSGVNGIKSGMRGLEETAQEIAEFNVAAGDGEAANGGATKLAEHADVAEAMVDLKVYQRQVQASAKVVQTADEVIGFLLDTHSA